MKDTNKTTLSPLLTLQEAAAQLGVPVEVLLQWNENHILTPRISRTGQIGYTPEQIAQFIAIRDSLQSTSLPSFQAGPIQKQHQPYQQPHNEHLLPLRSYFLATATAGVVLVVVLILQQTKVASLQHLAQQVQNSQAQSQTKQSSAPIDQTISLNKTNKLTDPAASDHLHTEDQGVFARNIFVSPTPIELPAQQPTTITRAKRVLASSSSAESQPVQAKHTLPSPIASVEAVIDDTSTLAEKTAAPCPSCESNGSADNALALGKAPDTTNALTSALGESTLTNSYSQQKLSTVTSQAVLIIFGSVGLLFLLGLRQRRRHSLQLAPAFAGSQTTAGEKILEINQKMDGMVVLTFKGKDYKISKPELDSDSDRFIERLMGLMKPGMQELEYESINDVLHLTTPLSRIVTRLGFVGIKRDLFFPRTSKHRVLFRKYITTDDLSAMNMTIAQLQDSLALPQQG